jgi:hypothetical protein
MKQEIINSVTPQQKLISVADKMGNHNLKNQQGTTRHVWDTLPLDGRTVFNFFQDANSRSFPDTNMGNNGGQLALGEGMIIERMYLAVADLTVGLDFNDLQTIDESTITELWGSELSILVGNQQVVKPIAVSSFHPFFNKSAEHNNDNNFEFDTQISIQQLLQFEAILRTPSYTANAQKSLRLVFEGTGAIISPKVNF